MIHTVKKYLKSKTEAEIAEIIKHRDLTDEERWLIYYTFVKNRMVPNTCAKLYMSESKFYKVQDRALIKLYYILKL